MLMLLRNIDRFGWKERSFRISRNFPFHNKKFFSGLSPDDLEVWSEFDPSEKSAFLAPENNQSRLDFFVRKKLEMQNRVVESIGNQSERICPEIC